MTEIVKQLDEAIKINELVREQLEVGIPRLEKVLEEQYAKLEEMKMQLVATESTLNWLKSVKTKAAAQEKLAAAPPGQLPPEARGASLAVPDDKSAPPPA